MNQNFLDFVQNFRGKKIAIAVSGGVDSICLMRWCVDAGLDVVCLHVNHGLRAAADVETDYVRNLCAALHAPCHIF